jgi:hypothetical protein
MRRETRSYNTYNTALCLAPKTDHLHCEEEKASFMLWNLAFEYKCLQ